MCRPGNPPVLRSRRLLAAGLAMAICAAAPLRAEPAPAEPPGAVPVYPSLQLRGFTDFDYVTSDEPDGTTGFDLGQLVLHMVSPLARKVNFFGEVTVTPRDDSYRIEVERSIVRYDHNDYFKVSGGRFHTQIGYWNTAFHHGLWLQTTVGRPDQIRFGTTFVPVHFVGAQIEGKLPSGDAGLAYSAAVGNGRSEILSRAGDSGDPNPNRAWIAQLLARPVHAFGFETGASVYHDVLSGDSLEYREWIGSGYVALTREAPELIGELFLVRHEAPDGETFDSHAFYVQAAWRLPVARSMLKPYARYEQIDIGSPEPVFTSLRDEQVVLGGVRADVAELVALKLEYRNQLTSGSGRSNTFLAQACLTF